MAQTYRTTGYEPLNTLKPVARDIWIIDGPHVLRNRMPISTRATVVKLENDDLWVHAPTPLTEDLRAELSVIGRVAHLVVPNQRHFTHIAQWQAAYPDAQAWAAPNVAEASAKAGHALQFDHDLGAAPEAPWDGEIDQTIVEGSKTHREVVFHHRGSSTLIIADLVANVETSKLPAWMRPLVWLAGTDESDGKMPPALKWSFRNKEKLADGIDVMVSWRPRRMILAHGRWYKSGAVDELERAFRKLLSNRRWNAVMENMPKDS